MARMGSHSRRFLALVEDAKSRVKQIDIEGYRKMRAAGEKHILVDVREDHEWAAGHAAGAVHLGKGIIERDIEVRCLKRRHPGALLRGRLPVRTGGG